MKVKDPQLPATPAADPDAIHISKIICLFVFWNFAPILGLRSGCPTCSLYGLHPQGVLQLSSASVLKRTCQVSNGGIGTGVGRGGA